jgi:cysteine desulfurase
VNRYYFDHNATTPVCPEAAAALAEAAGALWANPSSVHRDGQLVRGALEKARRQMAELLSCAPKQIVFTSGGTEAANLAILGTVRASTAGRRHVITSAIEHPAVLGCCAQLEREGVEVSYLAVDSCGLIDPDHVRRQIRPHTVLITCMHANNETGVVEPIAEIAAIAREHGVVFHSDGVQAVGKIPVSMAELQPDLYSLSAHKFYALKGSGALYIRHGVELHSIHYGGRHEGAMRPGTENVPGILAMGAAAATVHGSLHSGTLRDRLEAAILDRVPDVSVNGAGAPRTPNTANLCFEGIEGEAMVIALDLKGFAVSTGAACSSGAVKASHVLLAMGLSEPRARSSLRFSLGRSNDEAQVDALVDAVEASAAHLRRLSPTYAHA